MTRSTKLMLPILVGAAVIAAFWFMVLAPKREEIARLDTEIATQQATAEQAEQLAASYEKSKASYRENYTTLARLGKAVTADDDVRSLLVQLDDAAARSNVDFRSLNVAGGGGDPSESLTADGLAPAPGTVAVGSAGITSMPFTFAFTGSYFDLQKFFSRLEHFVTLENERIDVTGRLLLLGSISVSPEGEGGKLKAEVGAATYLVPPVEGVAGAPTPDPAATVPATEGTPTADGGTVPNTTATITGVR